MKINKILSMIIIVFGILGILIGAGTIFVVEFVNLGLGGINDITTNTATALGEISTTIRHTNELTITTSQTIESSQEALKNAESSLIQISGTTNSISKAFKWVLFAGKVVNYFAELSSKLSNMANDVRDTNTNLGETKNKLVLIGSDLNRISDNVDTIRRQTEEINTYIINERKIKNSIEYSLIYIIIIHSIILLIGINLLMLDRNHLRTEHDKKKKRNTVLKRNI